MRGVHITHQYNDNKTKRTTEIFRCFLMYNSWSTHRGRTEDFPVQFPLAVDVVLRDLHLETSRLSIKQLHAINRPNHLDVTSWCFFGGKHKTIKECNYAKLFLCWCMLICYVTCQWTNTFTLQRHTILGINCSKTFYAYMLKKTIFKKFQIGPN